MATRVDVLKIDVQHLLMDKLNAVDYRNLLALIEHFNESNKIWMLSLILNILDNKYSNRIWAWCVLKSEPDEYISISQEILDILEGNICTYEKMTDPESNESVAWRIYPLRE